MVSDLFVSGYKNRGVGVAVYDPYYGKGACLQMQRSVSFKPFYDH